MFIEQAFRKGNEFWKYIVGFVIVIIGMFIGQLPWLVAIAIKVATDGGSMPMTEAAMMGYLDRNATLFFLLLSFAASLLTLFIVVKNMHNQKFKEIITSRPKVDWNRVGFAFVIWAIFSAASVLFIHYTEPDMYVFQFNAERFIILAIIAIIMIPLQSTAEELIFRGYLMQGFGLLARNRWLPLALTSIIFGALHLANPEVAKMGYIISLYYIGTGLFLGIMTLMDEGTELALGFHAANNLVAALLVTADWTAFQTDSVFKDVSEPSAGVDILLPLLVIYPILLFIFSKKYGWSSWREKLTGRIRIIPEISQKIPYSHDES